MAYADNHFVTALGNLGSFDTNFTLPFLVFWFVAGPLAVLSDAGANPRPQDTLIASAASFATFGVAMAGIYLAMYITWTSYTTGVGAELIDSVQGRYSLPLLPFLMAAATMMLGYTHRFIKASSANLLDFQLCMSAIALSMTLFVVIVRYWVPPVAAMAGT